MFAVRSTDLRAPVARSGARAGLFSGVLPRVLRRPFRVLLRTGVSDMHVPGYAAPLMTGALLLATCLYGMSVGGHWPQFLQTMTAYSGFAVTDVRISGNGETSDIDVLERLDLNGWTSLVGLDVDAARDQVASLPWVQSATVRKVYPDAIEISVVEKTPFAIWQYGKDLMLVEADGKLITPFRSGRHADLPLVVGEGAAGKAQAIVARVAEHPEIASRVESYVRVGNRRWDLRLDNGVTLKLPEEGVDTALSYLADTDRASGLLSRDILAVDMRLEDRLVVQLTSEGMKQRTAAVKEMMKQLKAGGRRT